MTMINTHNLDTLIGADVIDTEDRKVGTVGQIYLDSASSQPTWVTIKTGLFGTGEWFAPLETADWTNGALRIGFTKSVVKAAPRIDGTGLLERADEEALLRYYGPGGATTTVPTDDAMTRSEE